LSVADNARDAVILHVSAASERQEFGNKRNPVKKRTMYHVINVSRNCRSDS
jgi:hypothetical protein